MATVVLHDVFLASFLLACVEPKLFFTFAQENSPVQPVVMAARVVMRVVARAVARAVTVMGGGGSGGGVGSVGGWWQGRWRS